MARFTSVYGDFSKRLDEVGILRRKAAELERSRESFRRGPEISALCRGAVVLLSSHIEAYVKELGEHTLDSIHSKAVCRSNLAPQFFYYVSKDTIEAIRDASQPDKIAKHMQRFVDHETLFWKDSTPLPAPVPSQAFNKGFSNPTFDKVKAYFGRFGYTDFRRDFFRVLGREAQSTANNLDQIVDTRNSIAHGDLSATKTPAEIKAMVETAKTFCRSSDEIFGNWCKDNLCSIR